MKKYRIGVGLLLVSTAAWGQTPARPAVVPEPCPPGTKLHRTPSSIDNVPGVELSCWAHGLQNGPESVFYGDPPRAPAILEHYRDGKLEGEVKEYFPNGQLRVHWVLVAGKPEGLFQRWYDNGQLAEKGQKHNGQKEGVWRTWRKDGSRISERSWKDGKRDGLWRSWGADGQLTSRMSYQNDLREGPYEQRSNAGVLLEQGSYLDDKLDGPWMSYDDAGRVTARGRYVRGKRDGAWQWFKDGKQVALTTFKNGRRDGPAWRRDPASGELTKEGSYHDGRATGHWHLYYPPGHLVSEGDFLDGQKVGVWTVAADPTTGAPRRQLTYQDGKVVDVSPRSTASWPSPTLGIAGAAMWGQGGPLYEGRLFVGTPLGRAYPSRDRSHYQGPSWSPGGEAAIGKVCPTISGKVHCHFRAQIGPSVRLGWSTGPAGDVGPRFPGFTLYGRVTPFVSSENGSLGGGVRLGVGFNALAWSRFLMGSIPDGSGDGSDAKGAALTAVILAPFALLNHLEVTGELSSPRFSTVELRAGVALGFGL